MSKIYTPISNWQYLSSSFSLKSSKTPFHSIRDCNTNMFFLIKRWKYIFFKKVLTFSVYDASVSHMKNPATPWPNQKRSARYGNVIHILANAALLNQSFSMGSCQTCVAFQASWLSKSSRAPKSWTSHTSSTTLRPAIWAISTPSIKSSNTKIWHDKTRLFKIFVLIWCVIYQFMLMPHFLVEFSKKFQIGLFF